ncbi:uncharacterized protein LOC129792851 [Lutzomyia longipalpis]|uniref:uncharacterized protein LOC129792851 n=1 Tax=Lutzomyia longipalpis TaxID=7200 RepID=UPI0024843E08|nr:uncharacterized protein LOC129792851 [Lutzomyia longipalpis]
MADNITNNRKRKHRDPHVAGGAAEYQDDFLDSPDFMTIIEMVEMLFENQGNMYKLLDAYLNNVNHHKLKKAKTDFQKLQNKYHEEKRAMSKAMSNLSVNMGNLKDCAGKLFDLFEAQFEEREDLHRKLNKAHEDKIMLLQGLQLEQQMKMSLLGMLKNKLETYEVNRKMDQANNAKRSKSSAR